MNSGQNISRFSLRAAFFSGAGGIALGLVLGVFVGAWIGTIDTKKEACKSAYNFVNVDVACGDVPIISKASYLTLRNDILDYIETQRSIGNATSVALYFRDLDRGPVFGVDELSEFAPASLLKLPLSIALFDMNEEEEEFFEKRLMFTQIAPTLSQTFAPAIELQEGEVYSVETLLFNTVVYSDNVSYEILLEYLAGLPGGANKVLHTFQELGILDPRTDVENTLTVRGYASLFRLLYNVSYLDARSSETLLSWLARSDFDIGLVAGIPEGIPVAHKFGEREIGGASEVKQLHDCGVVYYPGSPYVLCIMTRGKDMHALADIIAAISNMVYEEVNSRRL